MEEPLVPSWGRIGGGGRWGRAAIKCVGLLAAAVLFAARTDAVAQAAPQGDGEPLRVLFIGNSFVYYNELPFILRDLAAAAQSKREMLTVRATAGGRSLRWHLTQGTDARQWASGDMAERLPALKAEYEKMKARCDRMPEDVRNPDIPIKEKNKKWLPELGFCRSKLGFLEPRYVMAREPVWDIVVLQRWGEDRGKGFADAVGGFVEMIRRRSPDAWILLYQHGHASPAAAEEDIREHAAVAEKYGLSVVPAGMAWARAEQEMPQVRWRDEDNLHPGPAASYLVACSLYAAIFNRSPEGIPYHGKIRDPGAAAYAQRAAWQAVERYKVHHARQGPAR